MIDKKEGCKVKKKTRQWVALTDLESGYENVAWEITKGSLLTEYNGVITWHGKDVCDTDSYMAEHFLKPLSE